MKKNIQILKSALMLLLLINVIGFLFLITIPGIANAQGTTLQVDIGKTTSIDTSVGSTKPIADYISAIYNYGIGIVGILATIVMMYGGFLWITAAGNPSRIGDAKTWIGGALTGLVLALSSYLILSTINPDLVNFQIRKIATITKIGCCAKDQKSLGQIGESSCKSQGGIFGGIDSIWDEKNKKCTSQSAMMTEFIEAEGQCTGSSIGLVNPNDPSAANKCSQECSSKNLNMDYDKSFYYQSNMVYCCLCKTSCADKTNGDGCFTSKSASGFCYNNLCLETSGSAGEDCGNEGGICTPGSIFCPTDRTRDLGGRGCISGYVCCK